MHYKCTGNFCFIIYIMVVIYHGLGLSFNDFCSLLNIPCFAMLDCCNHYAATLCPRFAWPVDCCVVDVDALIVWLLFDKDSAWGIYLASFLQFFYSISLMCRCGVGIYSIFDEWNQGGRCLSGGIVDCNVENPVYACTGHCYATVPCWLLQEILLP